MPKCPVCAGEVFTTLVPARKIDEECRMRERFVNRRLARPAAADELKDLTDFFHQAAADILACAGCWLLFRQEHEKPPAQTYSRDEYDPELMERLYPQYLNAFRAKQKPYRTLLPAGARVIEIGSHYGAFLQTANEWGWHAEGVDVGQDTSRFAKSKGFDVHVSEVAECHFPNAQFDAVFIWNCFEQIKDPKPVLAECRRILKPGGLLTLRVPNGLFYKMCQALLSEQDVARDSAEFLIEVMGYNNLLGFPYLYGHHRATLEQLARSFDFQMKGSLNSQLLTLPLPEEPQWVAAEERIINSEARLLAGRVLSKAGKLIGPWIELWFRSEPAPG